jgi:hypothetical protein
VSQEEAYRSQPDSGLDIRLSFVRIESGETKVSEFDVYAVLI